MAAAAVPNAVCFASKKKPRCYPSETDRTKPQRAPGMLTDGGEEINTDRTPLYCKCALTSLATPPMLQFLPYIRHAASVVRNPYGKPAWLSRHVDVMIVRHRPKLDFSFFFKAKRCGCQSLIADRVT